MRPENEGQTEDYDDLSIVEAELKDVCWGLEIRSLSALLAADGKDEGGVEVKEEEVEELEHGVHKPEEGLLENEVREEVACLDHVKILEEYLEW